MRIVTPSAGLTFGLLDISFFSVAYASDRPLPLGEGRNAPGALANPWQLLAHQHVNDAAPPDNGLHHHTSGAVVGHLANPRRSTAQRMGLERRQRSFSIFSRHDADDLALVRKIKRIKTQN